MIYCCFCCLTTICELVSCYLKCVMLKLWTYVMVNLWAAILNVQCSFCDLLVWNIMWDAILWDATFKYFCELLFCHNRSFVQIFQSMLFQSSIKARFLSHFQIATSQHSQITTLSCDNTYPHQAPSQHTLQREIHLVWIIRPPRNKCGHNANTKNYDKSPCLHKLVPLFHLQL